MAPKKKNKYAGGAAMYATASVQSKKNLDDIKKAAEEAEKAKKEEEQNKRLEEERLKKKKENPGKAKKDDVEEDSKNTAKSEKEGKSKKRDATKEEKCTTWEELLQFKEKEEMNKIGLKKTGGEKSPWDYLKPAGVISLQNDTQENLLRQFQSYYARRNEIVVCNSTEGKNATTDGKTACQKSMSTTDPVCRQIYFPDAFKLKQATYDRLTAVYVALQDLGFSDEDIVRGMSETYGYDARACLEYIVLTTPYEKERFLPAQFQSEQCRAELLSEKRRMEAERIAEEEQAIAQEKRLREEVRRKHQAQKRKEKTARKAAEKDDGKAQRNWILEQYENDAVQIQDDCYDTVVAKANLTFPKGEILLDQNNKYVALKPDRKNHWMNRAEFSYLLQKLKDAQNTSSGDTQVTMRSLVVLTLYTEYLKSIAKELKEVKKQVTETGINRGSGIADQQKIITNEMKDVNLRAEILWGKVSCFGNGNPTDPNFLALVKVEREKLQAVKAEEEKNSKEEVDDDVECHDEESDAEGKDKKGEDGEENEEDGDENGEAASPEESADVESKKGEDDGEEEQMMDLFEMEEESSTAEASKDKAFGTAIAETPTGGQAQEVRRMINGKPMKIRRERMPLKENLGIPNSWTGNVPSKVLDNYIAKSLGRQFTTKKSYDKELVGRVVVVQNASDIVYTIDAPYRTKWKKEAVELASTYALYVLQKEKENSGSSMAVEELLPPSYRSVYRAWVLEDEQRRLEEFRTRVAARVKFCMSLATDYSKEQFEKGGKTTNKTGGSKEDAASFSVSSSTTTNTTRPPLANFSPARNVLQEWVNENKTKVEELKKTGVQVPEIVVPKNFGTLEISDAVDASDDDEVDTKASDDTKKGNDDTKKGNDDTAEVGGRSDSKSTGKIKVDMESKYRHEKNRETAKFQKLYQTRCDLPVAPYRDEIVEALTSTSTRVCIVSGSTGSGKTTQVPQFVLESALANLKDGDTLPNILVTEPRRISAISVATRVAEEMGERIGGGLVGYQIRLEKVSHPRYCRLLFCTTGVLLQKLKNDPHLAGITHVFVDEVHERSAESDLALLLLKRNLRFNNLKLCLMSATADEGKLLEYFGNLGGPTGIVNNSPSPDLNSFDPPSRKAIENATDAKDSPITNSDNLDWLNDDDVDENDESTVATLKNQKNPNNSNSSPTAIGATMNTTANLKNATKYISVPGRIYPVEEHYLEDILERTGFSLDVDNEYANKDFQANVGANKSVITTKQTGGGIETHVSFWDNKDDEYISKMSAANYPGYSRSTVETLVAMDHFRINYDLIEATCELIEKEFTGTDGSYSKSPKESDSDSHDNGYRENPNRQKGAVLIFLPGLPEITKCYNILSSHPIFGDDSKTRLITLHSVLTSQDQRYAFEPPPPGIRKIVLSTNIAETGVTIPDVVFVIDSGKVKEQTYHEPTNTSSLKEVFVSQAQATQRRGRAGRVRNGFCFRLYTRDRFDKKFLKAGVPELLRCSLTELMLSVLIANFQPSLFTEALDVPPPSRITHALTLLQNVGCCRIATTAKEINRLKKNMHVDVFGESNIMGNIMAGAGGNSISYYAITALGSALARLPVDIRLGKMLLLSQMFGESDTIAGAVASLSNAKSCFIEPFDEAKKRIAREKHEVFYKKASQISGGSALANHCPITYSDHLAACEALKEFETVTTNAIRTTGDDGSEGDKNPAKSKMRQQERQVRDVQERMCKSFWLNRQALQQIKDIKTDLREKMLKEFPIKRSQVPEKKPTRQERNAFAASIIAAGLRPNIARVDPKVNVGGKDPSTLVISAANDSGMKLHNSSSFVAQSLSSGASLSVSSHGETIRWLAYYQKMRTTKDAWIRDATAATPISVLLFHTEEWDLILRGAGSGSSGSSGGTCVVFNNHKTTADSSGRSASTGNSTRDWQCIGGNPRSMIALRQLKLKFNSIFSHWILADKRKGNQDGSLLQEGGSVLSVEAGEILDGMRKVMVESK